MNSISEKKDASDCYISFSMINIYICRITDLQKSAPIAKSSSDQRPFIHHSEPRTTIDMSECDTNTEDYITCTDASKRGIVASSTTQMPGSNLITMRSMLCLDFIYRFTPLYGTVFRILKSILYHYHY